MSFKRTPPTKRKSEPQPVACRKSSKEHYLSLNWNGRTQYVGVVQLRDGRLFKLEDAEDSTSRRTPITEHEKGELVTKAMLANVDRRRNVDEDGNVPDLTDLHWDCSDADIASQFQLVPAERGWPRLERDLYGHLDVEILVGDRVKVALNVGFTIGCTFASAEDNVNGEVPDAMAAQLVEIEEKMGVEKYWAHVLAVEGEHSDAQKLTILSPSSLTYLVSQVASEPYVVERKCVYAHHASSLDCQ
jgi:hypothetical protein